MVTARAINWTNGGGWNDSGPPFPDWLQIDFGSIKAINEVDVFTLQDNYANSAEPTESMTFAQWGLTAFTVEYWDGTNWIQIPGASVTGNNKIWRKFEFSPISTSKIRVVTSASVDGYSRLTEVEAYGLADTGISGNGVQWLVPDHLGTPRIVLDQTGIGVKRHDYLPFGEELFAGTGGRTAAMGYTNDGVRQHFTAKERDNETGLDYFGARYYASVQGRFTSPDPLSFWMIERKKQDEYIVNPQRWNKYAYVLNNPLRYVDPDGLAELPAWNDLHKKLRDDLAQRLGKDAAKIWDGWSNDQRQTVLNVRAVLIDKGVWGDVANLSFGNVSVKDEWGPRNSVNFTADNSESASALAVTSNKNLEWVFAGNAAFEGESANWNHIEGRTTFKQKGDDIILHAVLLDKPADDYTAFHFDSGGGSIVNSEQRSDWWNKSGPSPDRVSTGLGQTSAGQYLKGISPSLDKLLTPKK